MRLVVEYLRAIVVSFEFVILLLGMIFILFWQERINTLSVHLVDNLDLQKYLIGLSVACVGWVFIESRKLLFPEEVKKKVFQSWPDYWKWKIYFFVGLVYSVLFALIGCLAWLLDYKVFEPKGFVMFFVSVFGGLVVALTVYLARIGLSEILAHIEE